MKRFLTSILTVLCAIGALAQNVGRPRSTPSNNTEDYITKKKRWPVTGERSTNHIINNTKTNNQ